MIKALCKILIAVAALGLAAPAFAAQATVQVKSSDKFGEYITDAEGRSLYLFKADTQGKSGKEAAATCYDTCATAWPPLVSEEPAKAGDKAKADLLGTIARKDGSKQITYNGWPLYYFSKDAKPGDTNRTSKASARNGIC
jgi:predicted lipoprotein with Yx(FWY)xxD motif